MMRVEGLRRTQDRLNRMLTGIKFKTEKSLAIILQAVSANTKPYIPVDTSTLINSETRRVTQVGDNFEAAIAYGDSSAVGANGTPVSKYAVYVHEGPDKNWQKPGARNRFLTRGMEDFMRDDLDGLLEALADDLERGMK